MRSLFLSTLLSLSVVLPAAAAELIRPDAAYSATRVMRAAGFEMSGTINHDHGKERWETNSGGMRQVMIRRPDQSKIFMVMPDMNMAMEMQMGGPGPMPNPDDFNEDDFEDLGREDLNGETVTKYRTQNQGSSGVYTVLICVSDDGIPLRMEGSGSEGDFEMFLTDLQRGAQDPALFELPADVQVMPMNPAMMPQGMGQSQYAEPGAKRCRRRKSWHCRPPAWSSSWRRRAFKPRISKAAATIR